MNGQILRLIKNFIVSFHQKVNQIWWDIIQSERYAKSFHFMSNGLFNTFFVKNRFMVMIFLKGYIKWFSLKSSLSIWNKTLSFLLFVCFFCFLIIFLIIFDNNFLFFVWISRNLINELHFFSEPQGIERSLWILRIGKGFSLNI